MVEILEREKATEATLEACRKFRKMGYALAIDDFVMDEGNWPLLDLIDIVKVEYPAVPIFRQRSLIEGCKNKVKFLAEKIETREEYAVAVRLGYDLFQGYFFSKPSMLNSKDVGFLNTNLIEAPGYFYCVLTGTRTGMAEPFRVTSR